MLSLFQVGVTIGPKHQGGDPPYPTSMQNFCTHFFLVAQLFYVQETKYFTIRCHRFWVEKEEGIVITCSCAPAWQQLVSSMPSDVVELPGLSFTSSF